MAIDKELLITERQSIVKQIENLQKAMADYEAAFRRGEGALQIIDMLVNKLAKEELPVVEMTEEEFKDAIAKGVEA